MSEEFKQKGTKMIYVKVRFWTNLKKNEQEEGLKMPKKTCWDSGYVCSVANQRHGIRPDVYCKFNNLNEIKTAIEFVMKESKVKIINSKKNNEYVESLRLYEKSKI